jgi:NitT/TauT family transport system ATP-binding protein
MPHVGAHIELLSIGHRYKAWHAPVLEDISLSFTPADRIAILGRSGCGKSTLLQIIAGLINPTEGKVLIDGHEVRGASPRWNLMFQRPLLFPWLNAAENVGLGLRFAGRSAEGQIRAESLLRQVGLEEFATATVTELSGGQQQRVALARSLATDPQALLLDEPFSALDAVTRTELRQEVHELATRLGLTLVLVTHDVDDALQMADRVIVLAPSPGRIVADIPISKSADRAKARAQLIELIGLDSSSRGSAEAAAVIPDFPVKQTEYLNVRALR